MMAMSSQTDLSESLSRLAESFDALGKKVGTKEARQSLESLNAAVTRAAAAFCGSWIGYHSRVYYAGLNPPPAGAHFSPEWGLMQMHFSQDTRGDWREYTFDDIYDALTKQVDKPNIEDLIALANQIDEKLTPLREELLSSLTALSESSVDSYVGKLLERATNTRPITINDFISAVRPSGRFFSRDSVAVTNGQQTPPHIFLFAQISTVELHLDLPKKLASITRQASSHLNRRQSAKQGAVAIGTKVFIGHSRSTAWRELKDFVQDRLDLEWDEFNLCLSQALRILRDYHKCSTTLVLRF